MSVLTREDVDKAIAGATPEFVRSVTRHIDKVVALRQKQDAALPSDLLVAAVGLLNKIDEITTEQFSKGGERKEREALRAAVVAVGGKPKYSLADMKRYDPS